MDPQDVINECVKRGIRIRMNGDHLTATPRRKLTDQLLDEIRKNRPAIIELLEGDSDVVIDDLPLEDPPEPTLAQRIIDRAASEGVMVFLDRPDITGRITVITRYDEANKRNKPLPTWLAAAIQTHQNELLEFLRAQHAPAASPDNLQWWERLAGRHAPTSADNQRMVKGFLAGEIPPTADQLRREAALADQLPTRVIMRPS